MKIAIVKSSNLKDCCNPARFLGGECEQLEKCSRTGLSNCKAHRIEVKVKKTYYNILPMERNGGYVTELITVAAAITTTLTFPNETRRAVLLLQLHLLLLYIKIKIKLLKMHLIRFTPRRIVPRIELLMKISAYEQVKLKIQEALSGG
jgi:hypothetical protein